MDSVLVEYLRSGRAWLFVGSGPSSAMGYPNWQALAAVALALSRTEGHGAGAPAFEEQDYPRVFQAVSDDVGMPRMLQALRQALRPTTTSDLYELLAKWPVDNYLTTNFDDEISLHLEALRAGFRSYTNSEDHLGLLVAGFVGGIFKLHGDLTTEDGLVLTSAQYRAVRDSDAWLHWRTKLTSIFQMNPVIVIGHSLTDPHVSMVLEAAKRGAGVTQPVIWIAPDVTISEARGYLDRYRIRVVPYDNRDGSHRHLRTLVRDYSLFVPPREAVSLNARVRGVLEAGAKPSAGAPAFYVFNRLNSLPDASEKRIEVALATIEASLSSLEPKNEYSLPTIFEAAGWPKGTVLAPEFLRTVGRRAVAAGLLARGGEDLFKPPTRQPRMRRQEFEHLRGRFLEALERRVRADFPSLGDVDRSMVAADIDGSLTGFFKEGGLTLASILFSPNDPEPRSLPSSIIGFIADASARYDSHLLRQAFVHVAIGAFTSATTPERQYLGRLSQGFFAFHALGAFGEVAVERLRNAQHTIWLFDSNLQIPAFALAAPTNDVVAAVVQRLRAADIRIFSTQKIFDETRAHLAFAERTIAQYGVDAYEVVAAANGEAPYRRQNQFLQGFIRWRESGKPADWQHYLFEAFGHRTPSDAELRSSSARLGLEVVDFQDWPGFVVGDFVARDERTDALKRLMRERGVGSPEGDYEEWLDRKTRPEAEAFLVVTNERSGSYHIMSDPDKASPAWFVSSTSLLNLLGDRQRVTWQPDGFLDFASTLLTQIDPTSADRAFEILLWGLAQAGASPVDEATIGRVFGGVIDPASLTLEEQREAYVETLSARYGESPEAVIARLRPSQRMLAALQLKNEIIERQADDLTIVRAAGAEAVKRAATTQKALDAVGKYRRKVAARQAKVLQRKRKADASRPAKRKKPQ